MNANPNEALVKEFSEVLEHMTFLFAENVSLEELPPAPSEGILVSIAFTGPFRGSLQLAVPTPMSVDLAANFLGIEPDEATDTVVHDAVKELLNVTCGHVLTALAGNEPVFSLASPQVDKLTPDQWEALPNGRHVVAFEVENSTALLRLDLEGSV